MPTVDDFEGLGPFTLEKLVDAANAVIRTQSGAQIQERTVRYYISEGLLPPPSGGPKFARYTMEHLRRVVAIREWLAQGISLSEAAHRLQIGEHGGSGTTYVRPSSSSRRLQAPTPVRDPLRHADPVLPAAESVSRVVLRPGLVLEFSGRDTAQALTEARDTLIAMNLPRAGE